MSRSNAGPRDWGWAIVLASLTFAVAPLIRPGLPAVADAAIHFFRTAEWVRVWDAGVLYPRWSPNLAFGYGFPLFIFAPPLPYAVAGALHAAGLSLASGIKALPMIGFVLMGMGMYLFVRDVLGSKAACVAAIAFAYAPFGLREAYVYGGNYPQFLAIATFPWMLWAFRRVTLSGSAVSIVAGGVVYAVLILSHIFHALVFTPVVAVYVLGVVVIGRRSRAAVVRAAGAGVLGLALSAAFWLPALYERRWSLAQEAFYVARSSFYLRFLSLGELLAGPQPLDSRAANPYVPFALGWVILFLAALGLLALVRWRRRTAEQRFHSIFFAALLALAVFMMLPESAPVWERAPFLAAGEFPWRFMGIASLAVAFLAGGAALWWERRGAWLAVTAAIVLVVAGSVTLTYPPRLFVPLETPTLADGLRYELSTQTIGTTTLGEYVPVWVKDVPLTSPLVDDYLAGRPIDKLDRTSLPADADAQQVEHTAVSDTYRVSSPVAWTLRLNTFYYPGWTATVDGRLVDVEPDSPRALIGVPMPAGDHVVAVRFGNIPVRTAADLISIAGLALAVILTAFALLRGRTAVHHKEHEGHEEDQREEQEGRQNRRFFFASLVPSVVNRLPGGTSVGFSILLILLVFVFKVAWVDPHTGWFRQQSPPDQVLGAQHPVRVDFDDKVQLLGYDLVGEPSAPGESLHVRLYWQALGPVGADYSSFVHLDQLPNLETRAQSDNVHPGDARAQIDVPVRNWTTDTYVRDEHTVNLPTDLAPIAYALQVGLYGRDGRRLPVLDENGKPAGDAAFLQAVHLLPRVGPDLTGIADARGYRFGQTIELVGTRLDAGPIRSGVPLRLHVFWRASAPPDRDYTVFVHVLDGAGKVVAQADAQPDAGAYPTSWWQPGQVIEDVREVGLDGVAPGTYRITLGVYELASGERLPVAATDGKEMPDRQVILDQRLDISLP